MGFFLEIDLTIISNQMSPLSKKLQIKPGQKVLIVSAPNAYQMLLEPLPGNVQVYTSGVLDFDNIQLFVRDSAELIEILKKVSSLFLSSTIIWIAYPKKSSGIKSDLDMMSSWTEPEKYGLRPVASVAIDETWTALRFKPIDQVKKSGLGNSEIASNEMSEYIDVKNRIVVLPPDLKAELEQNPGTLIFFDSLAWSHKKEYLTWILSAKQEKTRLSRVKKAAEMLASNKKNPAAK